MKRILLIEDDSAIALSLTDSLREHQYEVIHTKDGELGYRIARHENFDLIILDLMLPKKNGHDICSELRRDGIATPILMLTSKTEEIDKVIGLEIGADDYVTKPFSIRELHARIKALFRRSGEYKVDIEEYAFETIFVDFRNHRATKNLLPLEMTAKEFEVLKYLVQREGEVVTRDMLLDDVWGYDSMPTTRTVDNFILSLRKKLEEDPEHPQHFLTIHSRGYRFVR